MARETTAKGGNSEYHKSTESAKNTKKEKLPRHARDAKDKRLFSGYQTMTLLKLCVTRTGCRPWLIFIVVETRVKVWETEKVYGNTR